MPNTQKTRRAVGQTMGCYMEELGGMGPFALRVKLVADGLGRYHKRGRGAISRLGLRGQGGPNMATFASDEQV